MSTLAQHSVPLSRARYLDEQEAKLNSRLMGLIVARAAAVREAFPIGTVVCIRETGARYVVTGHDKNDLYCVAAGQVSGTRINYNAVEAVGGME